MKRLRAVEGVRALAALGVVLFHGLIYFFHLNPGQTRGTPQLLTAYLWLGVDVFFVLSAFLLSQPMLGRPVPRAFGWGRYLLNRSLRLTPPYYASILLFVLMGAGQYGIRDLGMHLSYLHTFDDKTFQSLQPLYWTIGIEAQLYLILPLLAVPFRSRRWGWALAGYVVASIAWRAFMYAPSSIYNNLFLGNQLPGFLGHFGLGIALARLVADARPLNVSPGLLAAAGGLGIFSLPLAFMYWEGHWDVFQAGSWLMSAGEVILHRTFIAAWVMLILWAILTRPSLIGSFLASAPMRGIGHMSYSLYLTHVLGFVVLERWVPSTHHLPYGLFLLAFAATALAFAGAFYALVEYPSERFRHSRFRRPSARAHPELRPPSVSVASPWPDEKTR